MEDPILNYADFTSKERTDANQDRKTYLQAARKFTQILTSGQWASIHRDASVIAGDEITSWEGTKGNSWNFEKQSATRLKATMTNYSFAYPADDKLYTYEWIIQSDPISKTFIGTNTKSPDTDVFGRYYPKYNTLQVSINAPIGTAVTSDGSPLSWGFTTLYYTHIV